MLFVPNLEEVYQDWRAKDKRVAAQIAYALGVLAQKAGDLAGMRRYRDESIGLFEEINVQSLNDAAAVYTSINGVQIPDLIHEGVVASQLAG